MEKLLAHLNEKQREAATTVEGALGYLHKMHPDAFEELEEGAGGGE